MLYSVDFFNLCRREKINKSIRLKFKPKSCFEPVLFELKPLDHCMNNVRV